MFYLNDGKIVTAEELYATYEKDYQSEVKATMTFASWLVIGIKSGFILPLDSAYAWETAIDTMLNEYNYIDILDTLDSDDSLSSVDREEAKTYIDYIMH